LRLGIDAPEDEDELLTMVCDEAQMIPDCLNAVRIELTRVSTGDWVMPSEFATCVQRGEDLQPLLTYEAGGDHDIMIVRACAVVDPWFPSTGLGLRLPKDSSGGYNIIASSAFVNEPSS
ncbi:MAG: pilus assembly protein, partial [Pseudomonadota bacterium]